MIEKNSTLVGYLRFFFFPAKNYHLTSGILSFPAAEALCVLKTFQRRKQCKVYCEFEGQKWGALSKFNHKVLLYEEIKLSH